MIPDVHPLALREADLSVQVALYDVSALLPRRAHRRGLDIRPDEARIDRVLLHHSGALGRRGFEGALRAVEFAVRKRRFPGAPYHFWVPHEPVFDSTGRIVVYRLAEDAYRAWHTGAEANDFGVGVAVQGNTSKNGLSESQRQCLEALFPWLAERHGIDRSRFGAHREGKKFGGRKNKWACPGKEAFAWLKEWRVR